MATTINGTTGRNASYWRYYLVCTEQDVNNANNTSKLQVEVYLGATDYSRAVRGEIAATHTVTVNGVDNTFTTASYTIEKNQTILLGRIVTPAITHNTDGSKTVNVSASSPDLAQASGYGPYSGSASGTVTLTKIARYPTGLSVSVSSKTINSVTVNWSANETCSAIKYGTSASSLTEKTVNAKSGSFTITGLTPEKSYTIYFNAKRSDSGLYATSNVTTTVTTHAIGKISSVGNFNHGSNASVVITNPSGSALSLAMKIGNSTILTKTVSAGTNTISFTDAQLDSIYKLYGSSNSLTATFIVTTASSYTNSKTCTITLTGNQKTAYIGANGKKRAKVYVGVNGTVKRAVVWIGNNGRKRCI